MALWQLPGRTCRIDIVQVCTYVEKWGEAGRGGSWLLFLLLLDFEVGHALVSWILPHILRCSQRLGVALTSKAKGRIFRREYPPLPFRTACALHWPCASANQSIPSESKHRLSSTIFSASPGSQIFVRKNETKSDHLSRLAPVGWMPYPPFARRAGNECVSAHLRFVSC